MCPHDFPPQPPPRLEGADPEPGFSLDSQGEPSWLGGPQEPPSPEATPRSRAGWGSEDLKTHLPWDSGDPPWPLLTRFQHLRPLGEGATAQVYRALDTLLQREVALKVLKRHARRRSALTEARAQAQVDHPHVCKVLEIVDTEPQPFIVLQLAEGPNLAQAAPGLDLATRLEVAIQVAEGVHAAHLRGLVHLDLKPANVLLQATQGPPHALLADFGMVKGGLEATPTACPLGTPPFTSPEQRTGDPSGITPACDIYALGMMLYVLAAERLPYPTSDPRTLLEAMDTLPRLPLRTARPDLPEDLGWIVEKCLAKAPGDRYPTALAVAEDLRRLLTNHPVQARKPQVIYRLGRWIRRNRALTWAMGLGLVVTLTTGVALGLNLRFRNRQEAWATQFDQEVAAHERALNEVYALPLHDIRPALARIRQSALQIEGDLARGDRAARGPALHALGRLQVLLNRKAEAARLMDEAWNFGYRPSSLALARSQRMIERFQSLTELVDSIPDPIVQARFRTQILEEFFNPAMALLASIQGRLPKQLAKESEFHRLHSLGKHEEAIAHAASLRLEQPWDLRFWNLEARLRIHRAWVLGRSILEPGHAPETIPVATILNHLAQVESLAMTLQQRAPSFPQSYLLAATPRKVRRLLFPGLTPELGPSAPAIEALVALAEKADPGDLEVLDCRLGLLSEALVQTRSRGEDPFPLLAKARSFSETLMASAPVTMEDLPWLQYELLHSQSRGWVDPALLQTIQLKLADPGPKMHPLERIGRSSWLLRLAEALAPLQWAAGEDPLPTLDRLEQLAIEASQLLQPPVLEPVLCQAAILRAEVLLERGAPFMPTFEKARLLVEHLPKDSPTRILTDSRLQRLEVRATHRLPESWNELDLALARLAKERAPEWAIYKALREAGQRALLAFQVNRELRDLEKAAALLQKAHATYPAGREVPLLLAEACLLRNEPQSLREGLSWVTKATSHTQPRRRGNQSLPPLDLELPRHRQHQMLTSGLLRALDLQRSQRIAIPLTPTEGK